MSDFLICIVCTAQQLHEPPAGFDLKRLQTRIKLAPIAALTLRQRRVGLDVGLASPLTKTRFILLNTAAQDMRLLSQYQCLQQPIHR